MSKSANRLTAAKKRSIYKLFYDKKHSIQEIAEQENITYWQVYRIVNGQTKLDGSPRRDKGLSRKQINNIGELETVKWSLEDFKDLDDFQLFLMMSALEDAASIKMLPNDKVKLVKDIEIIQTKIQQRQLKGNIRRPDAEVIARIIRRFKPDANNQEIVQIYKEEMELYIRERE
jgi:hypothetical protein